VCQFNDKYFFLFGGKAMKDSATIDRQPFDFVNEVEVYEIDRGSWKTINYISDINKLKIINSGTF
jgi:hypothetical protein